MTRYLDRTIKYSFYALFFIIPLIVYPFTSELFEFNKIIAVYALTAIITAAWVGKMIYAERILFEKTGLFIPLIIFLSSQVISSLISLDTHTSFFGYYSRFHGGLLSTTAYLVAYWAFVSNMAKEHVVKSIKALFLSGFLVSVYAVLQHHGIDSHIWIQDVQTRVFASLGQPNWLAAWITAILPLTWFYLVNTKSTKREKVITYFLSMLFFISLLFTKSRSGILGFSASFVIFWIVKLANNAKKSLMSFLIISASLLLVTSIIGTPWTPSLGELLKKDTPSQTLTENKVVSPALEVGGTASTKIREIVWQGSIDIWKHYPIFGTGVETFAFSYYNFRPQEHNLVSEWDYLYNKAHNEYLNIAATTGTYGLITYLFLIIWVVSYFLYKCCLFSFGDTGLLKKLRVYLIKSDNFTPGEHKEYNLAFLSGFTSILITNFFGFSVVPVALLFFLFPAMSYSLSKKKASPKSKKTTPVKAALLVLVMALLVFTIFRIGRYWYADYLFAQGKAENDSQNLQRARVLLSKAISLNRNESIFWIESAEATAKTAASLNEQGEKELALEFANQAVQEAQKAQQLSPADVNIKRRLSGIYVDLSEIDPNYLLNARETLKKATDLAPTDAKLHYNLGLAHLRIGDQKKALEIFEKTVDLKPDYRNARFAVALVSIDLGNYEYAKNELEYILENINPNDAVVKRELEELQSN